MNKKELQELSRQLSDDCYFLSSHDIKSKFERVGLTHLLSEINEKSTEIRSKLDDVWIKLKELKDNCKEHKYEYTGHDSHKNYYECKYCGAEDWD